MKYQFYAIVFDVAGNQVSSRSVSSPLSIASAIQLVTSLTVSPSAAQTKNVGQMFTITPTVSPSNANNKNVNWTSSNTSVANVSKSSTASGTAVTVTCKAAGTTTITATAADGSGKSASLSLTIKSSNITASGSIVTSYLSKYRFLDTDTEPVIHAHSNNNSNRVKISFNKNILQITWCQVGIATWSSGNTTTGRGVTYNQGDNFMIIPDAKSGYFRVGIKFSDNSTSTVRFYTTDGSTVNQIKIE